jgi:hypothetical protein
MLSTGMHVLVSQEGTLEFMSRTISHLKKQVAPIPLSSLPLSLCIMYYYCLFLLCIIHCVQVQEKRPAVKTKKNLYRQLVMSVPYLLFDLVMSHESFVYL